MNVAEQDTSNTPSAPISRPLDEAFRKSSYSNSAGCVEVAQLADGRILVRDTKDPLHTTLSFTPHEWRVFLQGVRQNEFEPQSDT